MAQQREEDGSLSAQCTHLPPLPTAGPPFVGHGLVHHDHPHALQWALDLEKIYSWPPLARCLLFIIFPCHWAAEPAAVLAGARLWLEKMRPRNINWLPFGLKGDPDLVTE